MLILKVYAFSACCKCVSWSTYHVYCIYCVMCQESEGNREVLALCAGATERCDRAMKGHTNTIYTSCVLLYQEDPQPTHPHTHKHARTHTLTHTHTHSHTHTHTHTHRHTPVIRNGYAAPLASMYTNITHHCQSKEYYKSKCSLEVIQRGGLHSSTAP